jgi:MFS family permease
VFGWLRPKETLSEAEASRGLRFLVFDGVFAQSMGVLTGGAFLVAFALMMGASLKVIGLLAAVGPVTQAIQIPAIFLIDRTKLRKALVIVPVFLSRILWLLIAALPWLASSSSGLALLLAALFASGALGSVAGCAWNSWVRDLVPENVMGRYFARRMAAAVGIGAVISLAAAFGVDFFTKHASEAAVYGVLFCVAVGFGMLSVVSLAHVPEPQMTSAPSRGMLAVLVEPFRDARFRSLLFFLGAWSFAVNLAAPFFTVYLLQRLKMSMSLIMVFTVGSQFVNVLFFGIWGRLADRFTNKSVLTVSAPMFLVSIVLWPFLTMPNPYFLTIPLLIVIYVLAGISTAGVGLCTGNIALKAAPKGRATAYLATNALIAGLAASVAPIVAGIFADALAARELSLAFHWGTVGEAGSGFTLPALNLRGLDFLFFLSFIFGLYAVHRLLAIQEQGEVEEKVVVAELYAEARQAVRAVSTIEGLRQLTQFPYQKLREMLIGKRRNNLAKRPSAGAPGRHDPPPQERAP